MEDLAAFRAGHTAVVWVARQWRQHSVGIVVAGLSLFGLAVLRVVGLPDTPDAIRDAVVDAMASGLGTAMRWLFVGAVSGIVWVLFAACVTALFCLHRDVQCLRRQTAAPPKNSVQSASDSQDDKPPEQAPAASAFEPITARDEQLGIEWRVVRAQAGWLDSHSLPEDVDEPYSGMTLAGPFHFTGNCMGVLEEGFKPGRMRAEYLSACPACGKQVFRTTDYISAEQVRSAVVAELQRLHRAGETIGSQVTLQKPSYRRSLKSVELSLTEIGRQGMKPKT